MTTRHRLRRRGAIVPLVAISLIALLGLIALAVDIGLIAVARTQAQDLADAAALAGTRQLNGDATVNNNLAAAQAAATAAASDNKILGTAPTSAQVTQSHGIYTYDSTVQHFNATYPSSNGGNAWSVMQVTVNTTTPTYFGRVLGKNSFNVSAQATAVHRPRDIAIVLDFSGSMHFSSETAYPPNYASIVGSLNPDSVFPKFGPWSTMSSAMQTSSDFVDSGGETHAMNNHTTSTANGPSCVGDWLYRDSSNNLQNAFSNPNQGALAGAFISTLVPVTPAPATYADQSDATYVGDVFPRKNKQTNGTSWASTVQEYLTGANNNITTSTRNSTFEGLTAAGGYGALFKGYSVGPGYYGKTFYMWPPDPRFTSGADPTKPNAVNLLTDINGKYICDWRKRFFTYSGTTTAMDDNSKLWSTTGAWNPATGNYAVNYAAVLAWIKAGPQTLPPNLRSGRVLYYASIPSDVNTATGTASDVLDKQFWKAYIDYVLATSNTYTPWSGYTVNPSWVLNGVNATQTFGTTKITAKSSLTGGTKPYMYYGDNPMHPRLHFWFGPMTMIAFLGGDTNLPYNWWPGTCHEAHCWHLKAGIQSALSDIQKNHPNDWAALTFFSNIAQYATPRVQLSRNYTTMQNALWFPFDMTAKTVIDLSSQTNEIRPYDSSFNDTAPGVVPNAHGATAPEMGFKVAYNEFSSTSGYYGRRGAGKVVIFETDGVPNTTASGTLDTSGGAYKGKYTGLGPTAYDTQSTALNVPCKDNARAVVRQICALDTANGYSTTKVPARVHCVAFGQLFEASTSSPMKQAALDFLLAVQKDGNTSGPSDTSIESYKIITGDYNTRIDKIRQALERIMQSGIQVSLIPSGTSLP
jgi:Flp pilus assembly protein TadG